MKFETITVDKHPDHPSILVLRIQGVYGNIRGWKSITFREGEPLTAVAGHLRKLADSIEEG